MMKQLWSRCSEGVLAASRASEPRDDLEGTAKKLKRAIAALPLQVAILKRQEL